MQIEINLFILAIQCIIFFISIKVILFKFLSFMYSKIVHA